MDDPYTRQPWESFKNPHSIGRTPACAGGRSITIRLNASGFLEADLLPDCFRKLLKGFFVLQEKRFDQIQIPFDPGKALTVFVEMRNEPRLIFHELSLTLDEFHHGGL
jgi:hypothetical protein